MNLALALQPGFSLTKTPHTLIASLFMHSHKIACDLCLWISSIKVYHAIAMTIWLLVLCHFHYCNLNLATTSSNVRGIFKRIVQKFTYVGTIIPKKRWGLVAMLLKDIGKPYKSTNMHQKLLMSDNFGELANEDANAYAKDLAHVRNLCCCKRQLSLQSSVICLL